MNVQAVAPSLEHQKQLRDSLQGALGRLDVAKVLTKAEREALLEVTATLDSDIQLAEAIAAFGSTLEARSKAHATI